MPRSRITNNLSITVTTTATYPLFRAMDDGVLNAATYSQQNNTDGDKTVTIRNNTQNVSMSSALDVDALAALGVGTFTLTHPNCKFKAGDLIVALYTVNTAGTVAPGETGIALDVTQGVGPGAGFIGA